MESRGGSELTNACPQKTGRTLERPCWARKDEEKLQTPKEFGLLLTHTQGCSIVQSPEISWVWLPIMQLQVRFKLRVSKSDLKYEFQPPDQRNYIT